MTDIATGLASLDAELAGLSAATTPEAMLALPVARGSPNRLLRGRSGEVCLLIASSQKAAWPDLKLRNVQAQAAVRCRVETPDGVISLVDGTLITCTASDPQLRRLFLNLMEEALAALGTNPAPTEIAAWLQRIATLFARLELEGRKQLRGLWAELLTMIALGDPELAARRWHTHASETFDFTAGSFAIEVKSCQNLDRIHHFSLSQLRPPSDLTVWLASVVTRSDPQGASVLDLLRQVEEAIIDNQTRHGLRLMVLAIGGQALEEDDLHRFDRAGALQTICFMDAREIPSIREDLPDEVLAATLQVRCRDVPTAGAADAACGQLRMIEVGNGG